MKVNSTNKRNINFNGFWDSKVLKKTLQFAARNGTLFAGTASLICATTVRPIAILSTPNTDEQNKKVACAKSMTSTGIGYLLMLAFSLPLSNAVRNIDKSPKKFLNSETIQTLKDDAKTLKESKAYSLATQIFKLGLGFILAAPKAILTAIGTPFILNKFDTDTNKEKNTQKEVSFKGKNPLEKTGHAVGGVCPFALPDGVDVYLDESMKRFETIFPACGSSNSAIEMTMDDLEKYSGFEAWVDVCKIL